MGSEADVTSREAAALLFAGLDRQAWVVTAADGSRRGGLLATWVEPASIDPAEPMLLAALAVNHFTAELVQQSGWFAAHLLRPDQTDLALRFALGSGRTTDKLAHLAVRQEPARAPILSDCAAWAECQVIDQHSTGDRRFFWGGVVRAELRSPGPWLCASTVMAAASGEQLAALGAQLQQDLELHRPLRATWLASRSGS